MTSPTKSFARYQVLLGFCVELQEVVGVDPATVCDSILFVEDLGVTAEQLAEIEESTAAVFEIEVPPGTLANGYTVGKATDFVFEQLRRAGRATAA